MRLSPLRCLTAGLLLALAATTASTIQAQEPPNQPPPPGGMGPPGPTSLLVQESIQNDLGLSDKQKGQIKSLQAGLGQKSRDTFQAAQENGAGPQEFMEAMSSVQREHQAALLRVLDKTQKSRFSQIELQREGFLAASRSEIANKLKLTAMQTKKIKTIVDEMRQEQRKTMASMFGGAPPPEGAPPGKSAATAKTKKGTTKTRRPAAGGGGGGAGTGNEEMEGEGGLPGGGFPGGGFPGGGPPGGMPDFLKPENQAEFARMQEKQKTIREASNTKIEEVLTDDQKTAFEKLTGKPFDFSTIQAGPPTPKAGEDVEKKADDAMPKADSTKGQPKSKTKKSASR